MIVCGDTYKETFEKYAKELHMLAKPTTTNGVPDREPHAAIEALANLFERFASIDIPFWTLDRFCYRLIKEANKELGDLHYTPEQVDFDTFRDCDKQHEPEKDEPMECAAKGETYFTPQEALDIVKEALEKDVSCLKEILANPPLKWELKMEKKDA